LWNASTGEKILDLSQHLGVQLNESKPLEQHGFGIVPRSVVTSYCSADLANRFISPSGALFAYLLRDTVRICQADATLLQTFDLGESELNAILWSEDEKFLALGDVNTGPNPDLFLLNLETGVIHYPEFESLILDFAFSPDGTVLVAIQTDATLKFWSTESAQLIKEIVTPFPGSNLDLAWSVDGTTLSVLGWDGIVRVYGLPD
jgi:WD40 repeat protein